MNIQKYLLVISLVCFSASSYSAYVIDSCSINPEVFSIPAEAVELCIEDCLDVPDPFLDTRYTHMFSFGEASYLCSFIYYPEEGNYIRGIGEVSNE